MKQGIVRLTSDHKILPFDCGDEDLNAFLMSDAKTYQEKLLAVTYLIESEKDTVLYFSLLNDKISNIETSNSFWRKVKSLFPHSKHRRDYPAVKIGRLGVNLSYQHTGAGWGSAVLDYIKHWMVTNNKTGCRFITVDAYRAAVPFYMYESTPKTRFSPRHVLPKIFFLGRLLVHLLICFTFTHHNF